MRQEWGTPRAFTSLPQLPHVPEWGISALLLAFLRVDYVLVRPLTGHPLRKPQFSIRLDPPPTLLFYAPWSRRRST
jgi:hypothetical protein